MYAHSPAIESSLRRASVGQVMTSLLMRCWLMLLAVLLPLASASAADRVLKPIAVSPNVYYFQGDAGVADASNQGFMSNAGFVITKEGVVVFDSLGTPVLGAAMIKAIRQVTPQPVKRVIVSHYHADHVYGLQAFKAVGAEIWANQKGKIYLQSDVAAKRLAEKKVDLFPFIDEKTRLVPADRWLDFSKSKVIRFTMGGIRFQLLDVSGSHADDDIMMFVENDSVLFAGDLFFTGRIPFVGNANSRVWLVALDNMLQVKPKLVVPGHGAKSTDPASDLKLTRDYLLFLRKTMGAAVTDLTGFDEVYAKTDWSAYAKYPAFDAANRLNAAGTYLLMEQESLERK